MINYEQKEGYIRVKWKRTELGRCYKEDGLWVYKPKGCDGRIVSEGFKRLMDLKKYLEHGETYSV